MTAVNPIKSGVVLGSALGLWHLTWLLMVAFGWAQRLIDFVFWMHFIKPVYVIEAFNSATAVVLIAVTSVIGVVIGPVSVSSGSGFTSADWMFRSELRW